MRVVRWFRCPVTGTGRVTDEKDDSYRPVIIDLPHLVKLAWSAVYYPSNPPYAFCVVRMEVEHDVSVPHAEEFDVNGMEKFCDEFPYFRRRWLDQSVHPAKKVEDKTAEERLGDPVKTLYFRSDFHTVNGLNARKLMFIRSGVPETWQFARYGGSFTTVYNFTILKRDSEGSETQLGFRIAETRRTSNGEGIQYAAWTSPETDMEPTDAIKVKMIQYLVYDGMGGVGRFFITEQLAASKLNAAYWRFYRYTYRYFNSVDTYTQYRYDSATYDTRITGFSYVAVPVQTIERFQEEGADFKETKFGATWG